MIFATAANVIPLLVSAAHSPKRGRSFGDYNTKTFLAHGAFAT